MKKAKFDKNNYKNHFKQLMKDGEFKAEFLREQTMTTLAYELSQIRENKHLTQAQLAAKVGMKQQVISRVEQGSQNTTLETLFRIAGGLGKKIKLKVV